MSHQNRDAFEKQAKLSGFRRIAGIDEAGRGPLAGPVVAVCCVLSDAFDKSGLKDSKQLTDEARRFLCKRLKEDPHNEIGIGIIDESLIDKINILSATMVAMKMAMDNLTTPPDFVLVDGNKLPAIQVPARAIIGGDDLSYSIAAASIIAKVTRDDIMLDYHKMWPEYGFAKHKGYGTKAHVAKIRELGPLPIHRFSFEPVKSLYSPADFRKIAYK